MPDSSPTDSSSMSTPTVVYCHLLNDVSGSPRVLASTIEALDGIKAGHILYVGSHGEGILSKSGIETRRFWYRRYRYRIITLLTYFFAQIMLYRALNRARNIPENAIIFVNTLLPFAAALWGRRNRRRVMYHVHEVTISPRPLGAFLIWMLQRNADLALYVSEDHRKRLPIPGVPWMILTNPVETALQDEGRTTPWAPQRSGRFEALMLASPRGFKGIQEFVAIARYFEQNTRITFTLVLNAEKDEIEQYISGQSIPGNLTIHPRTDNPGKFYAKADVVLNLSRPDLVVESFGLTLAEAMCFGVPVIAPPLGGPAEIVQDGVEGFLIDARNLAAVSEKITLLFENPELATKLSDNARRRSKMFGFAVYSDRMNQVVSNLRFRDRQS